MLWYVMLWYVMLLYVMLRYVVLWYVMLLYVAGLAGGIVPGVLFSRDSVGWSVHAGELQ